MSAWCGRDNDENSWREEKTDAKHKMRFDISTANAG